jgi:hypothetical protein
MQNDFYRIATPTVTIDNVVFAIVPNTFTYTEGLGEQNVRPQSSGGGSVTITVATNVETCFSSVKFSVENTQVNIEALRRVKSTSSFHVIAFFDNKLGFTRTVQQAVLTNNYDVGLGADTPISLEFMGAPAV